MNEWEQHLVNHMSPETCKTVAYLAVKKAGVETYLDLIELISKKGRELREQ